MIHSVDHPLIIAAQAVVAVAMLRLFFALRQSPFPLPQLVLGLVVALLFNLVARATDASWFYIADIAQYWCWAGVVVASVVVVIHAQKQRTKQPGAPVIVPNFFDRWQNKITWGFGMVVGGVLLYWALMMYTERNAAKIDTEVAVVQENTRLTTEYERRDQKRLQAQKAKDDSLFKVLDSLSKIGHKTLTNQGTILGETKGLRTTIHERSALTRKTIREAVKPRTPDVEKVEPKKVPVQEEKPFWKRIFGKNGRIYSDTLTSFSAH